MSVYALIDYIPEKYISHVAQLKLSPFWTAGQIARIEKVLSVVMLSIFTNEKQDISKTRGLVFSPKSPDSCVDLCHFFHSCSEIAKVILFVDFHWKYCHASWFKSPLRTGNLSHSVDLPPSSLALNEPWCEGSAATAFHVSGGRWRLVNSK